MPGSSFYCRIFLCWISSLILYGVGVKVDTMTLVVFSDLRWKACRLTQAEEDVGHSSHRGPGDIDQMAGCLLPWWRSGFIPITMWNWSWYYTHIIPSPEPWREEGQEFKVILNYFRGLRSEVCWRRFWRRSLRFLLVWTDWLILFGVMLGKEHWESNRPRTMVYGFKHAMEDS